MKLVSVQFHNFRSAANHLSVCNLELDPEITCLIGTSESGKSNLLEAMAKFETGEFIQSDIPYSLITGRTISPSPELPMLTTTYELEPSDSKGVKKHISITRNYKGPLYAGDVGGRTVTQIGGELIEFIPTAKRFIERLLRSYGRQRLKYRLFSHRDTGTAMGRLHRLFKEIEDRNFESASGVTEIVDRNRLFSEAYRRLGQNVLEHVSQPTLNSASETMVALNLLVEELASQATGGMEEFEQTRPKFRLILSEPTTWLQGEYSPEELLEDNPTGSALSAKLLLGLAELDFSELERADDIVGLELLESGGKRAADRLNRYWKQDELTVTFLRSPNTKNLMIYIGTADHRGVPTQRSLGFRWYLEFMLIYANALETKEPIVFLFDEPGIHLHPTAQEDLKDLLRREIAPHMQVVFTTHLPGMVDTSRLDRVRCVVKNDQNRPGTWIINEEYSPHHGKLTWDVALKAIGLLGEAGPRGYEHGRTVVVEGLSDKQYLSSIARHLANQGVTEVAEIAYGSVRIFPAQGATTLSPICDRMIANESNFVVLVDKDEAGLRAKASLLQQYNEPNEWFMGVFDVSDVPYENDYLGSNGDEHEIEDLFGPELYTYMVNHVFADLAASSSPFEPPLIQPSSKIKHSAQQWLTSAGEDPRAIYKVGNQFSMMLSGGIITLPPDVASRFALLIDSITKATTSP